jgi:hypothetical protein
MGVRTCMSTLCPSPLCPSKIAVTTTSCLSATKLRMHRSYLAASCGETGWRSNLRAAVSGAMTATSNVRRRSIRSMANCVHSGESVGRRVVLTQVPNEARHLPSHGKDRCCEANTQWGKVVRTPDALHHPSLHMLTLRSTQFEMFTCVPQINVAKKRSI